MLTLVFLCYFLNIVLLVQVYHEDKCLTVGDMLLFVLAPLNMVVVGSMKFVGLFVNLDEPVLVSRSK
jgi:hypothetical protein